MQNSKHGQKDGYDPISVSEEFEIDVPEPTLDSFEWDDGDLDDELEDIVDDDSFEDDVDEEDESDSDESEWKDEDGHRG